MMDWFRHDIYAEQDLKIRKLVRECGFLGYGLYWHAVELLYQNEGSMETKELEEEFDFIEQKNFLSVLLNLGLLKEKDGVVFCSRVKKEIEFQEESRKKKSDAGKRGMQSRWGEKDNTVITPLYQRYNTDITPYNTPITPYNKGITHDNKGITPDNTIPYHTIPIEKDTTSVVSKKKPTPISRFSVPTLQEVMKYCSERGNSIDPQKFIDFYESKGWLVGKSPMKDWKAAVRNWERSEKSQLPKSKICNDAELMRAEALPDGGVNL